ncbi:MAG: GAF domain-containing sensor histidine kinase [Myxococcota bacterium]
MTRSGSDRQRVDAVRETGLLDNEPNATLMRAARLVRTALGAPITLVTLIDRERQYFAARVGGDDLWGPVRQTPLHQSFCKVVADDETPLVVVDASRHPRFRNHPAHRELRIAAYAGVPIRTNDGLALGALCAIDSQPREWSNRDLAVLTDAVSWVAQEMDLRRQLTRAQASALQLSKLSETLQSSQEATTSSTRMALHDLRSPLTALGIGLDQLAYVVDEPPVTRLLKTLHRNLDYITSLVEEASDEMGVGPTRVIDAARVAAAVRDHVTVPQGVRLQLDVPTDVPAPVRFGKVLLRRCLVNLTDNALRFASACVRVSQTREGQHVVTRVDDDGPGLPDQGDYARIGEPHLRLHTAEGRSGSGLGLAIASQLLTARGGELSGEPSPFGGARLEMRLPLA